MKEQRGACLFVSSYATASAFMLFTHGEYCAMTMTAAKTVRRCSARSTIDVNRESSMMPASKLCTTQPFPHVAVWFAPALNENL